MKTLLCAMAAGIFAIEASAATNYVDCSLSDYNGHDGSSWSKAFKTIQEGVDAAVAGGTVLVAPGDYNQGGKVDSITGGGLSNRVLIVNKAITLKSAGGAAVTRILGSCDRNTLNDATHPGLGSKAVRCICVVADSDANTPVIDGFTIADGATDAANDASDSTRNIGGGVLVRTATGTRLSSTFVVDCVITNCIATRGGGGDGGIYVRCRVEDCDATKANSAAIRWASLYNCLIVRNGRRCPTAPAVAYVFSGGAVVNCTFAGNAGKALGDWPRTVYNCLFTENGDAGLGSTGSPTYGYCLVDKNGGTPSSTCIKPSDNFQLFAPAVGDYRLLPTSLAVHAGDVSALDLIPEQYRGKDFDGNARKTGDTVNIGCYETIAPAPEGGAVIFYFKATVNGVPGYCTGLHAYSANYPEMFDVSVTSGAYEDETFCLYANQGDMVTSADRWFPKWDDERMGIVPPPSSFFGVSRVAAAQTLWVQDGYAGGDSDGTSEKPYTTIQDAVTAAGTMVTVIRVRPGTYATGGADGGGYDGGRQMNRVRTTASQKLRIVSTGGPSVTTILGASDAGGDAWGCSQDSYRCVYLGLGSKDYPQAIQGFTLSGGRAAYQGAGVHVNIQKYGVITDCIITNCISPRSAAVLRGRIERCWIVDNFFSDNYGGTSYPYNDITEQGIYSSCVFSGNRAPDQTDNHPVVGAGGTMIHCSGIDNKQNRITDNNIVQVNCVWDSFIRGATDRNTPVLSVGDFAINTPIGNNDGGQFTLIDSPLARTLPFCRVYASSPAVFGGSADYADYFKYASLDYEGNLICFKDGKPTAGAFQSPAPSAVASSVGTDSGIAPVGEVGAGLAAGATVTFSATRVGQRPFVGLCVDGELLFGVSSYSWTVPSVPCYEPLRIEAVYGTNWFVNANGGDDSNSGSSWSEARRTLEGVMTNAISGDVVTAAPGMYNAGSMIHSPLVEGPSSVRSRVVVPEGVTLQSSEGATHTFIVGASSGSPVDEFGNGAGAMRCVFMEDDARLIGFTITGGRIDWDVNHTEASDLNRGAGVYCRSNAGASVSDCIISNNVGRYGGGGFRGVYSRCRITDNRALVYGGAACLASFSDCFIDGNKGNGRTVYIFWSFLNCTFGSGNLSDDDETGLLGFNPNKAGSSPIANSVFLFGKVAGAYYLSNTVCAAGVNVSNIGTPLGETVKRGVAASDLQFDMAGRPVYGHCEAIDFGDAVFRDASCGDRDVDDKQRIYNGQIDAGCCEFDWCPVYARTIGGRRAVVTTASPDLVLRADGKAVTLVDGSSMDVMMVSEDVGMKWYMLKASVTGTGTLSVLRGGELLTTFSAHGSDNTFKYRAEGSVEALTFAFVGDGSADILSCRTLRGAIISFW